MVRTRDDPFVTIVIPILHDTAALTSLLPTLPVDPSVQLVVVDGGAEYGTAWDTLGERHPYQPLFCSRRSSHSILLRLQSYQFTLVMDVR